MDAKTIANYMLYIMSDAFDDLTNMKINKLLYFAQGHYLAKYDKPLFEDSFEAWEHGPVVPAVYNKYKEYDNNPINSYDTDNIPDVSKEIDDILFSVAKNYGILTASTLRNKTHAVDSPWHQVYNPNEQHTLIPIQMIEDYFSELPELKPTEKTFKEDDFIGYRDSEGYLVLPGDWDDDKEI